MQLAAVTDDLDPGYLANVIRVRGAPFHSDALQRLEGNEAIVAALGQPLLAELPQGRIWPVTGTSQSEAQMREMYLNELRSMTGRIDFDELSDDEAFAHVSIPIRGSRSRGKLLLFASLRAGCWRFHFLSFEEAGSDTQSSLLTA